MTELTRPRHYEELTGGEGRRVFYRAERFKAREVFRSLVPEVEIGGEPLSLLDISLSGMAVVGDRTAITPEMVGEPVPVRLRLGDSVLYSGTDRIARVEPALFRTKVALECRSGIFDVKRMIEAHDDMLLRHVLKRPANGDEIDPQYRQFTADVLDLLRRYRSLAENYVDARIPHMPADRLEQTLGTLEEHLLQEWEELWYRGNDLVRPIMGDAETVRRLKAFTERVLTPDFLEGPIWQRCYEKPLGYPGDFQCMNYVYTWRREGQTGFGKLMHRVGLEVAECIATRMVAVQQTIGQVLAAKPNEPVRVMSIGCGPAQEMQNALDVKSLPTPLHITLIDQDRDALGHAYSSIYPKTLRFGGQATVQCLQLSFRELLKQGTMFRSLPSQDLIYTVGLVDYLSQRRARELAASLFEQLAPGGLLVIGNMKDTRVGNLWPLEFVTDWALVYRTEAEMLDMVRGLPVDSVEVREEPTGRVYLLYARKAAA